MISTTNSLASSNAATSFLGTREMPVQPESREHLAELLKRGSGSVVFTTIHKLMPEGGADLVRHLTPPKLPLCLPASGYSMGPGLVAIVRRRFSMKLMVRAQRVRAVAG